MARRMIIIHYIHAAPVTNNIDTSWWYADNGGQNVVFKYCGEGYDEVEWEAAPISMCEMGVI